MHEPPANAEPSVQGAGTDSLATASTSFAPPASTTMVTQHRTCIGCGYDVFGLPKDGVCPECGKAVALTRALPLLRDLGDAGTTLHLGVKYMMVGAWMIVAAGPATALFGPFTLVPLVLGLLAYLAGWCCLLKGFGAAVRNDRRINDLVTPTLPWVMTGSLILALLSAAAALAIAMNGGNDERLVAGVLALTSVGSGVHFLGLPIVLNALRRFVDGRGFPVWRAGYSAFTFLLHGICLLWTLAIELVMSSNSPGSMGDSLEFAAAYLFTIPVHAVWLLVTAIAITRLCVIMGRETAMIGAYAYAHAAPDRPESVA